MERATAPEGCMQLCNSAYLMQKYEEVNGGAVPYALLQINLKNFRYFNTKYGAEAGDEILRLVFAVISDWLEEREYAAHLYADNFGLLVQCEDAERLAQERVLVLFDKLYRISDERIYRNLFYSMGIYQMADASTTFYDALDRANLCRKETDGLQRRCHSYEIYNDEFLRRYTGHVELEMRTAEAYKNYEFINFLQPKVNLKTGEIVGAEALLRWFDKDGKCIPLGDFLPILDNNGYIILVDIDTFEHTCRHLEERIRQNKRVVPVSFNISKCYFRHPSMVADYIKAFEKYNIPKELIQFELMESIAFNEAERLWEVVSQFREYGFTCALDDFGDGYSSFGVLLNAPLDIIKVDRQFFLNNLNGNSELVVKTVIDLIHSLKMQVVAEGVENPTHIEWLKNCGCEYVQGYYYYKPMPVAEFDALLDG